MWNPVKIIDFAREVIRASGLMVDRDIEIKVTGTRPGEKLHEQLWNEDAKVTSTSFPMVFRVHATPSVPGFSGMLKTLTHAARGRHAEEVRTLLREMPIDYRSERAHSDRPALIA